MHTPLPIVPLPAQPIPPDERPKRPYVVAYRIGTQRHELAVQATDVVDALLQAAAEHGLQLGSARPAPQPPALSVI